MTSARSMSRAAMPPVFIKPPASTKKGIASRANELLPAKMR